MCNMDIKREGRNGFIFVWVCRENFWMIYKKLIIGEGKWMGRDVVRGGFLLYVFL